MRLPRMGSAALAALAIAGCGTDDSARAEYLRQRGSPESKPVGAGHDATGVEG